MKTSTKVWLIIAVALILVGSMIFGGAMTMLKWDFTKLSTNKYETREHEITDEFQNISVLADTADVVFVPTEDTECRVVCYEQTNVSHEVAVKDGTLMVELIDTRKWYEHIGFNFQTSKITVYMPAGEYAVLTVKTDTGDVHVSSEFHFKSIDASVSTGDVTCFASALGQIKITATTGDITLQDVSAGSLDLAVTTGKVTASGITGNGDVSIKVSTGKTVLTDVICQNLSTSGSTGDVKLTNVIASGAFVIKRTTGDVTFEGCDAAELLVATDTGNVEGTLLTEKIFFVETDTGRREYPKTTTGGKCEITTDTGDIKISIKK
jgi:DUF4097 and DUF4098 domain-containing protein YvlB